MTSFSGDEGEGVLREWRARILNVFLTILACVAVPVLGLTILNAAPAGQWLTIFLLSLVVALIIALAILRSIDHKIRT